MRGILWFLALTPLIATASSVLVVQNNLVVVQQDVSQPFVPKQAVCIYRKNKRIACGRVSSVQNKVAVVQILKKKKDIQKGDVARGYIKTDKVVRESLPEEVKKNRAPAAKQTEEVLEHQSSNVAMLNDFTLGLNASPGLIFPVLHFQRMLTPTFAIGVAPGVISGTSGDGLVTITGYGGMITANYYGASNFEGMWLSGGAGVYSFKVDDGITSETASSLSAMGSVGYRFTWDTGFNIGISAGVQYTAIPKTGGILFDFKEIRPLGVIDAGLQF